MRKILILDDDYNELVLLETFFKKMGFDVIGLQKSNQIDQTILGFVPQLMIISYPNRNYEINDLMQKLKKNNAFANQLPIFIGLLKGQKTQAPEGTFDQAIHSPVTLAQLIKILAQHFKIDEKMLSAKFATLQSAASENKPVKDKMEIIKSNPSLHSTEDSFNSAPTVASAPSASGARAKSYDSFLKKQPPLPGKILNGAEVREHGRRLKELNPNPEVNEKEAAAFLKALFEKGK